MESKRLIEFQEIEIEELECGTVDRLSSLQRLVCELLAKNHRLRMALMAHRVDSRPDTSASFSE
jgi:hypothetical protein